MVDAAVEDLRFPKAVRLRQASQFKALTFKARRLRGAIFEIRYCTNDVSTARLGLIIPKRLARRSILRNLIKRLVREAFRVRLPLLPSVDIVVRLSRPVALATPEGRSPQHRQLRADIDTLLAALAA